MGARPGRRWAGEAPRSNEGIAGDTLHAAFAARVARHPDAVFVRDGDGEESLTWAEVDRRVRRLAGGLAALGVARGDRVGMLVPNVPAFFVCDLAIVGLGAVPVSIYGTSSPEQIGHVLEDAAISLLICDATALARARAARDAVPGDVRIVVIDAGDALRKDGPEESLSRVAERCPEDFDLDAETARARPDDLLTMIYTSGTTGPPKGVELSHDNLLSGMRSIAAVSGIGEGGRVISWLPAAHIAERAAHYYSAVLWGLEITTCADPRTIAAVLPRVRPTWFFAVPRVWEKIAAALQAGLEADGADPEFAAAVARNAERVELEQAGEPVPAPLAESCAAADARYFAPLRARLGLDAAEFMNVGAAPIARDVLVFLHSVGLPVAEIWGMSEACACGTLNPPAAPRLGSVGPPLPGIELRLEPDGEILLRGRPLMRGYHDLPERNREAFTADGFFRTGDVGRIDADGYLWIVDRKKELIINSAGKNMSPANIEATIKSSSQLIAHAVAIGDARPYVTALLLLDPDAGAAWAARNGADPALPALAGDERLRAEIAAAVEAANSRLARVETVRRFTVLGDDWAPGGEELTPTSKLRRRQIHTRYAEPIAAMYAGDAG
jgi:long-subunit acyl-CoA synthetase (AMP-forming)